VLVFAGAAAAVTYVAAVDPNEPGHYPLCPFLYATGYYCPGCGTLRMINAAAHGHLGAAFGRNPLAFTILPVLAYLWVRWTVCRARERQTSSVLFRPQAVWAFMVVAGIFWLVRNLPFGHALAP
jgi:hypothetical protein